MTKDFTNKTFIMRGEWLSAFQKLDKPGKETIGVDLLAILMRYGFFGNGYTDAEKVKLGKAVCATFDVIFAQIDRDKAILRQKGIIKEEEQL